MASIKFNHAFTILMAGCAAAALFIPKQASRRVGTPLTYLFAPVSEPVNRGSAWLGSRITPEDRHRDPSAPRSFDEVDSENATLRAQLLSLATQLEQLKALNSDRQMLGDIRQRAVPARVTGQDAGVSRILQVVAPAGTALADGMPAITPTQVRPALVGRVVSAYGGAARVRLTTDAGSQVQCAFKRLSRDPDGRLLVQSLGGLSPLVVGTGSGLRISMLSLRDIDAANVQPGDWAVVWDTDFDPQYSQLQGSLVGRVKDVTKSRTNPLMAEVTLEPPSDPTRLREVMIVTH